VCDRNKPVARIVPCGVEDDARHIAADLSEEWSTIQPSEAVRSQASDLVNRYPLRTADALQLAAALEWCKHSPRGNAFLTADDGLREAALLSGFDAGSL
jgi:predicted nucleic acid-binding protein